MSDRQTYCCSSFAGQPEERLADELFTMSAAWYEQHPIAVGCSSKDLKHHQRECSDAIRADYFANRAAIEQRCGFFEPLTVISIILTIIRLLYDWTHQRA